MAHALEWLKFKRLIITDVAKDEDNWISHNAAGYNLKWFNHFGKQFDSVFKNYTLSYECSLSTPGYSLKRNKSIYPNQDLFANVHGGFTGNSKKNHTQKNQKQTNKKQLSINS